MSNITANGSDEPKLKSSNLNATMWAILGDSYFPCEEAVKELPPGQFTIEHSNDRGIYFSKKDVNLDDLLILPDSATDVVLNEIEEFWKREDIYRKYRYLWKRGILLWGPPGSGKTTTVQLISKRIIDRGGLSVYIGNPKIAAIGLRLMRKVEPKRPIVVMLEDIDAIVQHYEQELLSLLDGELQIDNVVFVATTNYPEKLDRRIVNRPSRFDLVKKVPMPSPEARKAYLLNREPELETMVRTIEDEGSTQTMSEIDYWVKNTDNFSVAHLKEVVLGVKCFGKPLEEVIKRMKKMMSDRPSSNGGDASY
jgi:SpoVK/Ycf46/Vps4 family AAA+-type ATPase